MRLIITTILFIIFISTCCQNAVGQSYEDYDTVEAPIADTTAMVTDEESEESSTDTINPHKYRREFMDQDKLNALRQKKDFQYKDIDSAFEADMKPPKPTSDSGGFNFDASILLWLIVAFAAVVVILQFSNINVRQLLPGKRLPGRGNNDDDDWDNIHEIDYDQQLNEAISTGNYSLATRLLYLQSLKLLSDRELIRWHINKTNWQYMYELKGARLQGSFRDITSIFEYVRYGNMQIEEDKFKVVQNIFNDFNSQVR